MKKNLFIFLISFSLVMPAQAQDSLKTAVPEEATSDQQKTQSSVPTTAQDSAKSATTDTPASTQAATSDLSQTTAENAAKKTETTPTTAAQNKDTKATAPAASPTDPSITPEAAKPATSGVGISVGPSQIRFSGKAGASQEAEIQITNSGASAVSITTEFADITNKLDDQGQLTRFFAAPGSQPYSLSSTLSISQSEFVIPAGQSEKVTVTVSAPADATGSLSGVVFFRGVFLQNESDDSKKFDKPAVSVQVQPRMGVLIFYDVEDSVKRTGKISEFQITPPTTDSPLKIHYTFENLGNADILLTGSFFILDEDKSLTAKGDLNLLRTFPKDKGTAETVWSEPLDPGKYTLVATLELGPNAQETLTQEAEFVVV